MVTSPSSSSVEGLTSMPQKSNVLFLRSKYFEQAINHHLKTITQAKVLQCLLNYSNNQLKDVYPLQSTIAQKIGISERQVRSGIHDLKELGLISVYKKQIGRRQCQAYRFHHPVSDGNGQSPNDPDDTQADDSLIDRSYPVGDTGAATPTQQAQPALRVVEKKAPQNITHKGIEEPPSQPNLDNRTYLNEPHHTEPGKPVLLCDEVDRFVVSNTTTIASEPNLLELMHQIGFNGNSQAIINKYPATCTVEILNDLVRYRSHPKASKIRNYPAFARSVISGHIEFSPPNDWAKPKAKPFPSPSTKPKTVHGLERPVKCQCGLYTQYTTMKSWTCDKYCSKPETKASDQNTNEGVINE